MSEQNFEKAFANEFTKIQSEKKPIILVMGGTGVGKSSLINLVLGRELAKSGAGEPQTKGIHKYADRNITLYDSEGYESGDENQQHYRTLINEFIQDKSRDTMQAVDLIWYCISLPSARITDLDINLINDMRSRHNKPIAVVFTQLDKATHEQLESMTSHLRAQLTQIDIFMSTTDPDSAHIATINELYQWNLKHLDESRRHSFLAASRGRIKEKLEAGESIIRQHTVTSSAVGASPIPFSDAAALVPIQAVMLSRLASLWDLPGIAGLAGGGIAGSIMTSVGKTIVGSAIKFIPVIGSYVGGVLNAVVAGGLTYALGTATNLVCEKITSDKLAGKSTTLESYFDANFIDAAANIFKQYKNKS